jgi:SAM-dependent methyltransferase
MREDRAPRRLTFVPFLRDGRCALVPLGDRMALPSGELLPGEDPLLDACLRIPLETAGFRRQGAHDLPAAGDHLYLWGEGDPDYAGSRPHAVVTLWTGLAVEAAARLRAAGDERGAAMVEAAAEARRTLDDASFRRDGLRLMEPSYLRAPTPQGGSGFGGTGAAWRARRSQICEAIDRDGSFLDAGCANGHLMESVAAWCGERGLRVEPYGFDLSAALVAEARRRLPQWADRLWVGDVVDWVAPDGRRFDFVHTLLDLVREQRVPALLDHLLDRVVAPGGRLLVSNYVPIERVERHPAAVLARLGYQVGGTTGLGDLGGREVPATAWVEQVGGGA